MTFPTFIPRMRPAIPLALLALPLLTAAHGAPQALAAPAAPGELIMLAPQDHAMPIVRFHNGALTGGIVKDLGDALARRLGRQPGYLAVDVPGVKPALTDGRADLMCYVMPQWIDGDYHWSAPMLPDTELVVARADAPRLGSLKDLRDQPVGTVAGYRYPRVERVLGPRFARTDAATMEQNIAQMVSGKARYTMLSEAMLSYVQRDHPDLHLRADLVFSSYRAQCALSRKSQVTPAELDRAVDAMLKDGSIDQILARYR